MSNHRICFLVKIKKNHSFLIENSALSEAMHHPQNR